MPKQVNRLPGIKPLSNGGYQARVSYRGLEESQNFHVQAEALRWQRNLKADLERAPEGIVRSKKKWQCSVIGPDGVVSETFATLDDAVQWQNQVRVLMQRGDPLPLSGAPVTLSEFAGNWLDSKYSDKQARKGTYASQLKLHVLPFLGDLDLRSISSLKLQGWVDELDAKGVGVHTIRGAAGAVQQVFKTALKQGVISKSPWVAIDLPKIVKSSKARAFPVPEFLALANNCGPYRLLVLVLGYCGLRLGEALALRKHHIDFSADTIRVSEAWRRTNSGAKYIGAPKNGRSREVPIPPGLLVPLVEACDSREDDSFLFPGAKGGPLNGDYFRKTWLVPAAKAAGIKDAGIHMLRHTCASMLIRLNTPITTVSEILGHSSVEITLKTYAHFYTEDSFAAMAKLSRHVDSYTE